MREPVRLFTTEDIAEECGVTRWTVWQWKAKGHLPRGYQTGPNTPWMVDRRQLDQILEWAASRPGPGRKPKVRA
jgi:predicted DNA-binding transcriptional regulator AlpA